MKSFVVMTYYHFMHATAMALTLDEKPNLYFAVNYLNVPDSTMQRIKETGVFNDVVTLDHDEFIKAISIKLNRTKSLDKGEIAEMGDSIFEEFLEPYYAEKMAGADTNDEIFVYNDFQFYYYYVSKHFKHVVGVEDGYRVLEQQMRVHKFKGVYVRLEPFIEAGYYPAPLWRQPNVDYIISSSDFEELDEYYREKLRIIDFYDLIELNRKDFIDALKYIFDVDFNFEGDDLNILIGQPLDRCQYCNAMEYYLFNRKLIDENANGSLVIKPHPAEKLDFELFEDRGVTVINKAFPIELLNYCDVTFDKGISFDSTSLNTLKCIEKHERILDVEKPTLSEIKDAVQRSIDGQTLTICIIVKAKTMGMNDYVNSHSYYTTNERVKYDVLIALDPESSENEEETFAPASVEDGIREYLANNKSASLASRIDMKDLIRNKHRKKENTRIRLIKAPLVDEQLFKRAWEYSPGADYYFCTDSKNLGLMVVDNIESIIKGGMKHVVTFPTFVSAGGGNRILGNRNVENLACQSTNTLLHRSILVSAFERTPLEFSLTEAMLSHIDNVVSAHRVHLSDSTTTLLDESMDVSFFVNRAKEAKRYSENIENAIVRDEFLIRAYSSIVDEYVTWLKLTSRTYEYKLATNFIRDLATNPEMELDIALRIAEALYTYRGREYTRFIYRDLEQFIYYQKVMTWILRNRSASFLESIRRTRKSIKSKLKSLKNRVDD